MTKTIRSKAKTCRSGLGLELGLVLGQESQGQDLPELVPLKTIVPIRIEEHEHLGKELH